MSQLPPAPWGKAWFHQKLFGYGSGLPCSWEGWAFLLGFLTVMGVWVDFANARLPGGLHSVLGYVGIGVMLAILGVVARGRTPGGWGRRSGPRPHG